MILKKHKALVLTSNSSRHIYFASIMSEKFDLMGIVSEPKWDYFETQSHSSQSVSAHLNALKSYENKYFQVKSFPRDVSLLKIKKNELNSLELINWAKDLGVEVVLLFGTGILSDAWLLAFPGHVINLHLGYSPRYRGSATLFWPFFNEELNFLGVTIHLASAKVDSGDILRVIKPASILGNYYDLTNSLIKKAIDRMPGIVTKYLNQEIAPFRQNKNEQVYCYKKSDFTEAKLAKVLKNYGD